MISSFRGDHSFLSNFFYAPFSAHEQWCSDEEKRVSYPTNEHFFQAMKAVNVAEAADIRRADRPGYAKKLGKIVQIRPDWEIIKDAVMECGLRAKFGQNPALAQLLIDTGDEALVEGNSWGDRYWGAVLYFGEMNLGSVGGKHEKLWEQGATRLRGVNMLGQILMEVRDDLRRRTYG